MYNAMDHEQLISTKILSQLQVVIRYMSATCVQANTQSKYTVLGSTHTTEFRVLYLFEINVPSTYFIFMNLER